MGGFRLYLCEKPDQARTVAKALGNPQAKDGYILADDNSVVTWAFGHLLEPKMPEDYNPDLKAWNWETLPFIPSPFEFKTRDARSQKQFRVISELFKKAGEIIVSTDADREGELIAYEIITQLRWKGPIRRLWLSDLTLPAVKKALAALRPGDETKPLYYAALARMCSDFLVGINMTRGATLKLRAPGGGKALSIGRVQTPTLALIVRQERKILTFKPTDYFELLAEVVTREGHVLRMRFAPPPEKRILDRSRAEALAQQASGGRGALSVEVEEKTQAPPALFDLNLLQQAANTAFGWSADHTLKIAQSLYDGTNGAGEALLTYPRTDSSALPEEHTANIAPILSHLLRQPDLAHLRASCAKPLVRKSVYNDEKVTAHHAIVPTAHPADLSKLSGDERQLYMLVSRTFIASHLPDHRYMATSVGFDSNGVPFRATGRQPTVSGWKEAFQGGPSLEDKDEAGEDDEAKSPLPPVKDGDAAAARQVQVEKKTTTPPKRFTEKSLLQAMKNIAAYVEDAAAKQRLREKSGIGTPATRAGIIETLKARDYIKVQKRQLVPTDTAMSLIESIESAIPDYADPAQTAAWEDVLEAIELGKATAPRFIEAIAAKVRSDLATLKDRADLKQVAGGATRRPQGSQGGQSGGPRRPQSGGQGGGQGGPPRPRMSDDERKAALSKGTPLKVSFGDKDKAKQLGAVWDGDRKVWVAPAGADLTAFRNAGFVA